MADTATALSPQVGLQVRRLDNWTERTLPREQRWHWMDRAPRGSTMCVAEITVDGQVLLTCNDYVFGISVANFTTEHFQPI